MYTYLYHALGSFRSLFSHHRTWLKFALIVLGFIASTEMVGVSSWCRFWLLDVNGYHSLLQFFRSSAWSLSALMHHWAVFVLAQQQVVYTHGRCVLLGDHTYVAKEGRRMPGVVTLYQESETQSKPCYFRGQCWGALGVVVGSLAAPFCLPLGLRIHQGWQHLGHVDEPSTRTETLAHRLVRMALEFTLDQDRPSILVLDAFFSIASVFLIAHSVWSIKLKAPCLTLIIRAKKNYVAYFEPAPPAPGQPGRPPFYGDKVKVMECFDYPYLFSTVSCQVYGRVETVSILALNLLWKPTGGLIRFVFAVTSRGPIVLMCSDLHQDPVAALELYCVRTWIEVMFQHLKHLIGAFQFRFWSKKMPRHSRRPTTNRTLTAPAAQDLGTVQHCWEAYERFVMLGAIALGLLQLIALKFSTTIWQQHVGFLRTRSRTLPSERTVKQVIAPQVVRDFLNPAAGGIIREIRTQFSTEPSVQQDPRASPDSEYLAA
jgi:DDE superfamily endonuclease